VKRVHGGITEKKVLNRYHHQPAQCLVAGAGQEDYGVLAAKYKDLKERFDQLDAQKKTADADLSEAPDLDDTAPPTKL
jgi:hypothetical protein